MKIVLPPSLSSRAAQPRSIRRPWSRRHRATLWRSLGSCAAGGLVFALAGSSWGAVYTYTPTTAGGTDEWSTGAGWTPGAPVSAATTELTFGTTGTAISGTYTSDNDNSFFIAGLGPNGGFQSNILDLNGTGGTAGVVNLTNSGGLALELVSNGTAAPVINLNALAGGGLTYNVYTPLTLDNNTTLTGNGTATFNLLGAFNGTGNLLKTGTSTVNFYAGTTTYTPSGGSSTTIPNTSNYTGSLDVEGGTFVLNGGTFTPPAGSALPNAGVASAYTGNFYTAGTLTVGANGTFADPSGANNPSAAFSALYGSGTISNGQVRFLDINYNGAGSDAFTGTFGSNAIGQGGSLIKSGVGTLDLTGASFVLNANGSANFNSNLEVHDGTLNAHSLAFWSQFSLYDGTVNLTPTASGVVFSASGAGATLLSGNLNIVPSATGNVTLTAAAVNQAVVEAHGVDLSLDLGSATSVSLVIGNSGYAAGSGSSAFILE